MVNAVHLVCVRTDWVGQIILSYPINILGMEMKLVLIALTTPLLILASDAKTEPASHYSQAVTQEIKKKAPLLDAIERYRSCIRDDWNSSTCVESYEKLPEIYCKYTNSAQSCDLIER